MYERPFVPAIIGVVLVVVIGASGGQVVFADVGTAQSPVLVENDITEDTTWASGTGPYRVVKSIDVDRDTTLTIEPGVTVEVAENVSITVNGNLNAAGEASNKVLITASAAEPSAGKWGTIRLAGPEPTVTRIQHTTIEYATNGLTVAGAQQIQLDQVEIKHSSEAGIRSTGAAGFYPTADVRLTDSHVHRNAYGIRGNNGAFQVVNSKVANNSRAGIWLENTLNVLEVSIQDSTITHNGIGMTLRSAPDDRNRGGQISDVTIKGTRVAKNGGLGVEIAGYLVRDVTVTDSQLNDNGGTGLHVQDRGAAGESKPTGAIDISAVSASDNGGAGMSMDASYSSLADVSVTDVTLSGNSGAGARFSADGDTSGISVESATVRQNGEDGIAVGAAERTSDVVVTNSEFFLNGADGIAVTGNNVSAIRVDDSKITRSGEAGVRVSGGPGSVRTAIEDDLLAANGDGVVIEGHPANVTANVIEHNTADGIRFKGAASRDNAVHRNDIYGNGDGLQVPESASQLVAAATNNYWGASSGPFHSSVNPEGEGNQVNGGLDTLEFLPFAETPFSTPNERPTPKLTASSTTVVNGSEVTFSGAESTDDGGIAYYQFHYADGETSGWTTASEVTRRYTKTGNYTVGLTVLDDRGVDGNETSNVTVRVREPTTTTTTVANNMTTKSNSNGGGNNGGSGNGNNDSPTTGSDGESGTLVPGLGFPLAIAALLAAFVLYGRFADR